jgi:hypothetical protein
MTLTKKQKIYLGVGVAAVAFIFLFLSRRAIATAIAPAASPDTGYLSYNVPAYTPGEGDTVRYGDFVLVNNPPGNCGGRVYYATENVLGSAQAIIAAQSRAI